MVLRALVAGEVSAPVRLSLREEDCAYGQKPCVLAKDITYVLAESGSHDVKASRRYSPAGQVGSERSFRQLQTHFLARRGF